ncbi:MAG TPA: winged helix-turn-helix domain-containing protein [Candidatus Acidoferrales bacterium]|nr:winged helix-turn-helix domain-containing protein [Candidatus Acidoferrales bacterium]
MNSGRFRFGLFEFDVATRELRREGVLLRLQSQPAQVLCCLVEHAGKVVSREELHRAVWGGETFVDFDRGLNFCIGQIRSALGDDSTTPRYVRTLPKRGYQFIAPVEPIGERIDGNIGERLDRTETISTKRKFTLTTAALICAALVLVTFSASAGYWLRSWQASKRLPIVAVLRFDNETGDPSMTRFSDGLTDDVVERLTSLSRGRYEIIGNARILRLPRDQRDLNAIASSLHAGYVVLGQVQSADAQVRILAHLIRLPDQTHLWVARMDRPIADSLSVESEAAQRVGAEFSERVVKDSSGSPLPEAPNR